MITPWPYQQTGIADYAYVVVNGEIRVHGTAERARGDWDFAAL